MIKGDKKMDGYMDVTELSRDQLDELKLDYFWELADENSELLDGITCSDEIPDDMVLERFKGVCFSCDDFSCTAGQY